MAARSLNKVLLIGNMVRDPEVRFTPQNTAVANFSIATNRSWSDANGQMQESTEFTRIVAWGKLAEIVGQILKKGRKVYVEGRLQTREWDDKQSGEKRRTTEVVAEQIIALDAAGSRMGGEDNRDGASSGHSADAGAPLEVTDSSGELDDLADDIPF